MLCAPYRCVHHRCLGIKPLQAVPLSQMTRSAQVGAATSPARDGGDVVVNVCSVEVVPRQHSHTGGGQSTKDSPRDEGVGVSCNLGDSDDTAGRCGMLLPPTRLLPPINHPRHRRAPDGACQCGAGAGVGVGVGVGAGELTSSCAASDRGRRPSGAGGQGVSPFLDTSFAAVAPALQAHPSGDGCEVAGATLGSGAEAVPPHAAAGAESHLTSLLDHRDTSHDTSVI